jgi:glutamyl/glutaminyl-tRNA synthetase
MLKDGNAYIAYDSTDELTQQKQEQESNGKYSFRYDKN